MQSTTTTRPPRVSRIAAMAMATSIALALSACGGSSRGGDPATNPPETNPPVVLPASYVVSGGVSGLAGQGLVLKNNAGDDLAIGADGVFTFATPLASGATYAVTVGAQPANPAQVCTVSHGSGSVGSSNVTDVSVICSTNGYTVGGTVSGLAGTGLVLQNNGGDDLSVAADGSFVFPGLVAAGGAYSVTVRTAPSLPGQSCSVTHGNGTVPGAVVTNVSIACSTPLPRFVFVTNELSANVSPNYFPTAGLPSMVGASEATGINPAGAVATPDGQFVYIANGGSSEVRGYTVGPSGWLTPVAGATIATDANPLAIAIHPNGRFLYTANSGGDNVSAFAIDGTGNLSELAGSPFPVAADPESIAISPDGKFLYTANVASSTVSGYAIDSVNGNLSGQVPGSPMAMPAPNPQGIAIDPTSARAYVTSMTGNQVYTLSIDRTTGQLTHIGSAATGTTPRAVTVHPSGKYVYVANYLNDTLSTFSVDTATGLLTLAGTLTGLSNPQGIAVDKSGIYLFIANGAGGNFSTNTIDLNTGLPGLGVTTSSRGLGPRALVVISE